jgi:hypothetical protein
MQRDLHKHSHNEYLQHVTYGMQNHKTLFGKHEDSLLGNNREISDYITAAAT